MLSICFLLPAGPPLHEPRSRNFAIMPLPDLRETDQLGREIFSSSEETRSRKGKIPWKVFFGRFVADSLSVDRLDHAPDEELTKIGDYNAGLRGSDRSFYGWAVVTVQQASNMGRWVEPRPMLENPFHSEIFLNLPHDEDRLDQAREHAHDLALNAMFRPPQRTITPTN